MSRKKRSHKRNIAPDYKYNHCVITKFINNLMNCGKKAKAEVIFYSALEAASENLSVEPVSLFETAVRNTQPLIEVRSRRVGGSTYQVPVDVRPERGIALAIRNLINAASAKKDKGGMISKLSLEFIDAYKNVGTAVNKRRDIHKMAESNKAYAHYNWGSSS